MRYFTVSGVSRVGLASTRHHFLVEGTSLLQDVHHHLQRLNITQNIRVKETQPAPGQINLAQARQLFIKARASHEVPCALMRGSAMPAATVVYWHPGHQPTGEYRVKIGDQLVVERFGQNRGAALNHADAVNRGELAAAFDEEVQHG